jgi:hypothetical protein
VSHSIRHSRTTDSHVAIGALGSVAAPPTPIQVGRLTSRDPILAFSSVMASNLLQQMSARAPKQRLPWVRGEMNKVEPGMGDTFVSKYREMVRRGKRPNQAAFDAMRLTLANQIARGMDKMLPNHSAAGLGDSSRDINSVFCGIGLVGTAGGAIAGSFNDASASSAIGTAGSAALSAAGCNSQALAEQARIAEANARIAEANAAGGAALSVQGDSNAVLYLAIGGGALLVGVLGVVLLKK